MAIGTLAAIGLGLAGAGSIASGVMGSNAADKASQAQVQSADAAAQVQREALAQQQDQYEQSRQDALGLYSDEVGRYNDSLARYAQERDTARADTQPYRSAGINALLALSDQMGLARPAGYEDRNIGDVSFRKDPGYQFAFNEGMKAVDARFPGMSRSGAKAKALTEYGQGVADQQYGNWLQRLSGIASVGQTATGQNPSLSGTPSLNTGTGNTLAQIGNANSNAIGNSAANTGNLLQNAAAARASGYVGSSNAWGGVANNLASLAGQFMPANDNNLYKFGTSLF